MTASASDRGRTDFSAPYGVRTRAHWVGSQEPSAYATASPALTSSVPNSLRTCAVPLPEGSGGHRTIPPTPHHTTTTKRCLEAKEVVFGGGHAMDGYGPYNV